MSAPLRVLESRTQPPHSCNYVYVMLILMFMICSVHVEALRCGPLHGLRPAAPVNKAEEVGNVPAWMPRVRGTCVKSR